MTRRPAPDLAGILHAFADLAPEGAAAQVALDVTRANGFVWLGTDHSGFTARRPIDNRLAQPELDEVARLAAFDELHRHEYSLREGWVFLAGRTTVDGERRELCIPLLSAPVRLRKILGAPATTVEPNRGFMPVWSRRLGDQEITALVADPDERARLEADAEFGGGGLAEFQWESAHPQRFPRLVTWIESVVAETGLRVDRIEAPTDPRQLRRRDGLVAVIGSGLYGTENQDEPERRRTLRGWADRPGLDRTALATLYGDDAAPDAPHEEVRSPFPLTAGQRRLVVRSRHDRLTVASGAPGTGKSHAVAAVAVDAVLRGESVLVATQSQHAAEVLADLLDRHPGPTPVVFGNGERRSELLDELTDRLGRPLRTNEVAGLDAAVRRAIDDRDSALRLVERSLRLEADAEALQRWEPAIPALVAELPRVFDSGAPLERISQLNDTVVAGPPNGLFSGFRHRRRVVELIALVGAEAVTGPGGPPHRLVADAVAAATARRASLDLDARGGIRLAGTDGPSLWDRLAEADEALRAAIGARAAAHDRLPASLTNKPRRAVSALLTALRAGRGQRRRLLAELDLAAVTHSVPLWVGNLHDIEDLLPATPGVFDLVMLDEASQIDQPYGALALLRGRRAVVVGDPRQLRHVSFTSDADIRTTLEMRELDHLVDRLDVRRTSTFDAAAAAAPVTWLDEHHRSVPHLIEFSARRFYRDRVKLLTRHPSTHGVRAIDVEAVGGRRGKDGVNADEVERALELVAELGADGHTVGIVSPFRAQADAVEAAILDRLDIDDIVTLGLRSGTVHAFQGGERDVVVVSLALDADSPAGSRRFVEDPNLFNVMITRARHRIVVLSSQTEAAGLLGDYLAWASTPPAPPPAAEPVSAWAAALGDELARAGHSVAHRYPVGAWELDLVVGDGPGAVGVECGVHRDGPDAHVERHLALRSAGWTLIDAFPSRWDRQAARAALELGAALGT